MKRIPDDKYEPAAVIDDDTMNLIIDYIARWRQIDLQLFTNGFSLTKAQSSTLFAQLVDMQVFEWDLPLGQIKILVSPISPRPSGKEWMSYA